MSWGPLFLVLGGLCLQHAQAGSHSLRYLFSFLSEPLPGAPQYSVVGYVDVVIIIAYTSESGRAGPRALWMEKITDNDPQYWEESAETFQEVKKKLNDTMRNLMEQNNQSSGLHVLQMMLGCELREDGSVKWFQRYAYDGSNYPSNTDPSTDTEDRQNSEELIGCITSLKKLLECGEESLRRRGTPRTIVSQREANNRTFLVGYTYGFYPRDIEVKWARDGVEIPWESKELLPNPDGTYQVRTTVEVQEGAHVKTYEYHVDHISLPVIVTATMEYEEKFPPKGAIIGGVIGALVGVGLLAAVVWAINSKKKLSGKSAYIAANQDPAPSDCFSQCSA